MNDKTDERLIEAGRKLFARDWQFIWASPSIQTLPPMDGLEIAFAGRSNVGKSSLINALTGRNTLARTSHTPGRTQQLNFFDIAGRFLLVDMPGYGYAAVAKAKVASWTALIHEYLAGRRNLGRVYLLHPVFFHICSTFSMFNTFGFPFANMLACGDMIFGDRKSVV